MGAHVIEGRGLAAELRGRLAAEVADLMKAGVVPGLAAVLVGSPAEAEAYERRVRKLAGELGYRYACERLPIDAEEAEVIATVGKLKSDPRVAGILVLKPLPDHVSEAAVSLGFLRNATVIFCDEHAHNAGRLAEFTKQADVLIVAAGVPGLIKKEQVREGVIAAARITTRAEETRRSLEPADAVKNSIVGAATIPA